MNLKLTRPIAFFDIETTGLNIVNDRIVEISILKVFPDEHTELKTLKINPTILLRDLKDDFSNYITELRSVSTDERQRVLRENFDRMFSVL